MFCPLPILLAAREMLRLSPGDLLELVGDDVGILEDMPVWCERMGHRLVRMAEKEGRITVLVEKGVGRAAAVAVAKPAAVQDAAARPLAGPGDDRGGSGGSGEPGMGAGGKGGAGRGKRRRGRRGGRAAK